MAKINPDADWKKRLELKPLPVAVDDVFYIKDPEVGDFKIKRSKHFSYGSVKGFSDEDDVRRSFFTPTRLFLMLVQL